MTTETYTLPQEVTEAIQATLASEPVVLFMKGEATSPMCGFSARAASILQQIGVPFLDINILESDDLRTAMKIYSNWPTFPQLYVNGELIGGCDIMVEMASSGELATLLAPYKK